MKVSVTTRTRNSISTKSSSALPTSFRINRYNLLADKIVRNLYKRTKRGSGVVNITQHFSYRLYVRYFINVTSSSFPRRTRNRAMFLFTCVLYIEALSVFPYEGAHKKLGCPPHSMQMAAYRDFASHSVGATTS